jgi:magnesium transporter
MIEVIYFDKSVKKADFNQLDKIKDNPVWIDITSITEKERDLLTEKFDLHHLTMEDLFSSNTRIKVEEFPKYLFCVFYGITYDSNFHLLELDFIIGNNFLITNHKKPIASFDSMKKNTQKLENLLKKGLDFLFHKLLDEEIDNYFPMLEKVDNKVEALEEQVTSNPTPLALNKIMAIKRELIGIRKVAFQQRDKTGFLAKNDYAFFSKKSRPYFRDIYDHAIRVNDSIESHREAISNTYDVYMSSISNKMNEVMRTLSIIATIALPLTVISSIYGTNFNILPGSESAVGFWIMILSMIALTLAMVMYFKKKRWY